MVGMPQLFWFYCLLFPSWRTQDLAVLFFTFLLLSRWEHICWNLIRAQAFLVIATHQLDDLLIYILLTTYSISLSKTVRSRYSLWTSYTHPLGHTSHLPKINVQTDKQMHSPDPILFCQLRPYHRFSGGKNSNMPQNWVISTFSAYSKYHQQTSNPIPFFLHYRKFLSLHKLVSVQWVDGPKKITFNLENSEQIDWSREQTHAHVWFKTKALL